MTILNTFTSLESVINAVRNGEIGGDGETHFNVYWKKVEASPNLDDIVYVGEPESVLEDVPDEEYDYALLPKIVKEKNWWIALYGYIIVDVIDSSLNQKPDVTNEEILSAINYYDHYDDFYDFIKPETNLPNPE